MKNLFFFLEKVVIPNPQRVAGFTSAEGCFSATLVRIETASLKYVVRVVFILTQHIRDYVLIESFKKYFNCGNVAISSEGAYFKVAGFSDVKNNIIRILFLINILY